MTKKNETPPPLYRQYIPPEDQGKVIESQYFSVRPSQGNAFRPVHPLYVRCNLRIDFGVDGGIYKVEWQNE